jgi:dipeptidyl aminopeptidase/acylaminoacyl peptidase
MLLPLALTLGLSVSPALADELISAGRVPDIETFMQIGYSAQPRITWDGNTLFFTSNSSGVNQVYRLDRDVKWPYQLTVFSEGVNFFSVSPSQDYMICGVAEGGDENSQLWLVDARTGRTRALTDAPEFRHEGPSWTHDGQTVVYRSNEANGTDFYLYHLDLITGEKRTLVEMEGWNSPGEVSPDDEHVILIHWDSNVNSDLYLVDLDSGKTTHLTPHEGEAIYNGARFSGDGESLHLITNDNPDGIVRLATLDIATRELAYVEPENPWEVLSVNLSRERDLLGWTVNEDGYSRLRIRDLNTGENLPSPPMDGQVGAFMFTDNRSVVFAFSSPTSTHDIWIWDWTAPELEKLTHSTYAGVDPSLFRSPRLVRYASFDGREIPAFLYLPPERKAGEPVPFVLHMHGGPESQFRPVFIRHFQYLMLNGYGILAPNVRGSSGYGKEYMDLDNYTNRLDSVRDMKAGADYLVQEGYTDPGMIAVKGGSYGGYMTMAAITEYPEFFAAAINNVGITNFVSFLENTADYRRHLREAEYGPLTDREFLESVSPLNKANAIETPLLVIHGENDPRVPVGEARQIIEAIEAKGGVVESLIFPDEGHGVSKRPNSLVMYRRMVEFLDRHLKDAPPPPGTE